MQWLVELDALLSRSRIRQTLNGRLNGLIVEQQLGDLIIIVGLYLEAAGRAPNASHGPRRPRAQLLIVDINGNFALRREQGRAARTILRIARPAQFQGRTGRQPRRQMDSLAGVMVLLFEDFPFTEDDIRITPGKIEIDARRGRLGDGDR